MADDAYKRFWGPQHEAEFRTFMAFDPNVRAWRNGFAQMFGEQPAMDDPSFDYRRAYLMGNRPQPTPYDTIPHWDSRGKASNHPTAWKEDFMSLFGVDPDSPGDVTPEQQQFVRGVMDRNALADLFNRGGRY